MAVESKTFDAGAPSSVPVPKLGVRFRVLEVPEGHRRYFIWLQLILAYAFMEQALWSKRLAYQNRWVFITALTILVFVAVDRPSLGRLGLGLPTGFGAGVILAVSLTTAAILVFAVHGAGGQIPANPTWPSLHLAWQYVIWALAQEFMLQSFFYTRCEELFGSSKAVWIAATLFAAAHLPSPILTTFTLLGGLFFCEMFRRYRSIYPIGVVHAVLGLTLAVTMPDSLLHHMRVGIGYLRH
jgi:membrane protease YdiL (CAAX protease family)